MYVCTGGWIIVLRVAWRREKVGKGSRGGTGFDRGAGLIAIMIRPISAQGEERAKREKMRG